MLVILFNQISTNAQETYTVVIRKRNIVLTLWDLISASAKLVTRTMVKHALVRNKLFHVFTTKILPFISDNLMLPASLFVSYCQ